jgi:hypothetical protein
MVLKVQAASAAVSGLPSDHFAFGWVVKVQVRPSGEVFQRSHEGAGHGHDPRRELAAGARGRS